MSSATSLSWSTFSLRLFGQLLSFSHEHRSATTVNFCHSRQYRSLCSCAVARHAYLGVQRSTLSVSRDEQCDNAGSLEPRISVISSTDEKKGLKKLRVVHAQKVKWRACTDVEIVLKERATSDHSQDRGSLHSPCSGVRTCFRPLHTLLGLSPSVPGHRLCLITDCQGQ